jgi:hypothetical protein
MDVELLLNWHKLKAQELKRKLSRTPFNEDLQQQHQFHNDAVELIEWLHPQQRAAKLADQEIKSRQDAVKSLEKVARDLITEARDMRRMFNMSVTEEDEDDE